MSNFSTWYNKYSNEITWWIIGWLTFGAFDAIIKGSYGFALLDAVLVYINYKLWKNNNA